MRLSTLMMPSITICSNVPFKMSVAGKVLNPDIPVKLEPGTRENIDSMLANGTLTAHDLWMDGTYQLGKDYDIQTDFNGITTGEGISIRPVNSLFK